MDGKWIPGLAPEMKIAKAGKIILASRSEVVRHWLPLVAHAEKDIEFVHQLRVSTRRAGAGLLLFENHFKEKDFRFAKKLLRSIRQAAGEARDWDVFQESLFHNLALEDSIGQSIRLFLFGLATSRRMAAQNSLVETARTLRQELDWLCEHIESFVHEVDSEKNLVFADLAYSQLQDLIHALRQASHPVPERYEALHQVRILGKRLRYAMELFVSCFAPPFKEILYPLIEEMQEILGQR
jgi:CHAD domain-containing protein